MSTIWEKKSQEQIKNTIFGAIQENINYSEQNILGVPASYLDDKVFSQDETFLKEAPFLSTLIKNPNHIGCHTLGDSESFFAGTQQIEKEVIEICGSEVLNGDKNRQDGYVASGGTEANIQALWIYRNYFVEAYNARLDEIAILCSEDSHYSMDKAANLLCVDIYKVAVHSENRTLIDSAVRQILEKAKGDGKKYIAVVCNMMTTMFGSVDDINIYVNALKNTGLTYKIHVDGAFGGFYYPFSNKANPLNFANPEVTSVTLDAHKMAQAPYGTGIFLIRKGLIKYANTKEASYVEGEDYTLIGSRSGANAVAIWMILMKNGPYGWFEKIYILQKRTQWFCEQLQSLGIDFYRHPDSNIITIKSEFLTSEIARKYGLVPDNHQTPRWYKVVVMEHVSLEKLHPLIDDLSKQALHA